MYRLKPEKISAYHDRGFLVPDFSLSEAHISDLKAAMGG